MKWPIVLISTSSPVSKRVQPKVQQAGKGRSETLPVLRLTFADRQTDRTERYDGPWFCLRTLQIAFDLDGTIVYKTKGSLLFHKQ